MPVIEESSFTVPVSGIGKADYSRFVSDARTRSGLTLRYNQSLKIFGIVCSPISSAYAWTRAALAAGSTCYLKDYSTGTDMPYSISAGYTLSVVSFAMAATENFRVDSYLDTQLAIEEPSIGGQIVYENYVSMLGTTLVDPDASDAHALDIRVTNLGSSPLRGTIAAYCILEAVGTPPLPETKTVQCKFCGHQQEVSQATSNITCEKCGANYKVYNLWNFKGTA